MIYTEKLHELIEQKFNHIPLVNVQTFGCVQNENDSEKIRGILAQSGFGISDNFAKGYQVDYVLGKWTSEEEKELPFMY